MFRVMVHELTGILMAPGILTHNALVCRFERGLWIILDRGLGGIIGSSDPRHSQTIHGTEKNI